MRPRRLLLSIAFSQIVLAACAQAVCAQAQDALPPAKTPAPRSEKTVTERAPLLFYLAKGEDDSCGDGCGEWIAAEGFFGQGSAQRFRAFLKTLSGPKLPVYFHSPGGLQSEALAIGRLMRERQMTAGVARTVPDGCPANAPPNGDVDKACQKLKRSGKVTAELHAMDANCNSACVYALIGAKVRQVPPGAILGVHASKLVRVARDGRVKTVAWEEKAQLRRFNGELRDYIRRMGINPELFDLAAQVAHEQIHRLSRDEIARFGIDDRTFQETHWTLSEKPSQPLAVFKLLAEARGPSHKEFRLSIIRLTCANPTQIRTLYVRGLASDDVGSDRTFKVAAGDRNWAFPGRGRPTNIDGLEAGGSFEALLADAPPGFFEAAAASPHVDIIEADAAPSTATPRVISLSTAGLPHAIEVLRQRCGATSRAEEPGPASAQR